MKKIISLVAFMLLCFIAFSQGGVNFEHLTFDEALAKAKAEKKLVFVDCYTTWCGPCKHMTEVVFPQEKAGEFFNPRFVCVKFDMEKGEGVTLRDRFKVKAFPTFLIIQPDGTIQHTIVGGGDLNNFIERVNKGLNEKTSMLYLNKQYEKGKMNNKQLMAYKEALSDSYEREKSKKIGEELASKLTKKEKLKADFWPVFEDPTMTPFGSDNFKFVLENQATFEKNIGKEKLSAYLVNTYSKALSSYLNKVPGKSGNREELNNIKQQIAELNVPDKEFLTLKYQLAEARQDENISQILTIMNQMVGKCSENDFRSIFPALLLINQKGTKAELQQVVALGDKFTEAAKDDRGKATMKMYFDRYKKLAHVGVYFEDLTLKQALEQAKMQRKMVFMDGYTTWCGPCKYMSDKVFTQEKVGDFFNKNFINVKFDMEKGEGPELAKKFGIRAYPTFLIIKADGTVQHKIIGGGEADDFIKRVEEGFDENKASGAMDAKYNAGNRDKAFLVQYVKMLKANYDPNVGNVVTEITKNLSDEEKISEAYWFIFGDENLTPKGSENYKYLLANREKFNQAAGKEKVEARLVATYFRTLMEIIRGGGAKTTVNEIDAMGKEISALKLKDGKMLLLYANIAKTVKSGNAEKLLVLCEREFAKLSVEEVPYLQIASVAQKTATPAQKLRWAKMGKNLSAKISNKRYKEMLDKFITELETKK